MLIYLLLLAAAVIPGIPLCRIKHGKLIYCIVCGLGLAVFSGVRWYCGYDFANYAAIFADTIEYDIEELMYGDRLERGYLMINKLIADYFPRFWVISALVSVAVNASVMTFIYKYCEKPYLAVFCYLTFGIYFNSFNFLRQILAACVLLYSVRYLKQGQFIRYLCVCLFASCFHISALILIPFYFILRLKFNYITMGVYGAGIVLFFIFSWDILKIVTKYYYSSYDPERNGAEVMNGLAPTIAIFLGIFLITAIIFRKDLLEMDEHNNILLNFLFFAFFFELCGTRHAILSRVTIVFYMPAFLVLIPQLFTLIMKKIQKKFRKDKKRLTGFKAIAAASFTVLCTGMYCYFIATNYNAVNPYRTLWDQSMEANDAKG